MGFNLGRGLAVALAIVGALVTSQPARADVPDAWITTKIKIFLLTTEGVSARDVNVDTMDGRVTLHGTVSTASEKAKAEDVVKGLEGVRDIRNLLQVVSVPAQADTEVSDDLVKTAVSAALSRDPALQGAGIKVSSVNAGVVLLTGKARSLTEHLQAIRTAVGVKGVRRVASEIESPDKLADSEIWGDGSYDKLAYDRSSARDTWITTAAKIRLLVNQETPSVDINVDTENGVVTLFGMVDSQRVKDAAAAEVRKIDGVKNVNNSLQVVAQAKQEAVKEQDQDVQAAVEKGLRERSQLADSDIKVEVNKGVARLTGSVKSQNDRLVALTVTRSTPGVRSLIDDLRLSAPAVSAR